MKKILIILFIIPALTTYSQDDIKITVKEEQSISTQLQNQQNRLLELQKEEGMNYLGDGKYSIIHFSPNGFVTKKKLIEKTSQEIEEYSQSLNATYKVISTQSSRTAVCGLCWKVETIFSLFDKDGNIVLSKEDAKGDKEDAKKELLDLKELLDMGLITQEEFDKKSIGLKKIILAD